MKIIGNKQAQKKKIKTGRINTENDPLSVVGYQSTSPFEHSALNAQIEE